MYFANEAATGSGSCSPCSSQGLTAGHAAAEHFQTQHFACDHDVCLERKFVVFASAQELKQHQGKEHADGMSAAERRRHLTVPINLQARPGSASALCRRICSFHQPDEWTPRSGGEASALRTIPNPATPCLHTWTALWPFCSRMEYPIWAKTSH